LFINQRYSNTYIKVFISNLSIILYMYKK